MAGRREAIGSAIRIWKRRKKSLEVNDLLMMWAVSKGAAFFVGRDNGPGEIAG